MHAPVSESPVSESPTFDSPLPDTDSPDIPTPESESAKRVFDRASGFTSSLCTSDASDRIAKIHTFITVLKKHRSQIRQAGALERGAASLEMDGELMVLKFEADHICKHLSEWMSPKYAPPSLMTLGKKCYTLYEPKGVVLVLPSWNAPFAISLLPTLGAIAAGNSVVLKPSELAPHSSALLARIIQEAFPNGEVSVLEGGIETAQSLLACPFNHIFYIGNNRVGRLIMKAAADHFASVTLEMGGKNPSIVTASADIADAALKTAWGRNANAGQVCICPDYVLVENSVADEFCNALVKEIPQLFDSEGHGFEYNPLFPKIINLRHFERIRELIEDARAKGATVLCGGHYRAEERYIAPTILSDVTDDMKIMQEEVFGPVLLIKRWQQRDEVIREIRSRGKPLALYIFASEREEIDFFIRNTSAGGTVINHNMIQSGTNPYLGFGGVNSSGMGRLVGWHSFNEASNARTIVEEGPAVIDPRAMLPPFPEKMEGVMTRLIEGKPIPGIVVYALNYVVRFLGLFKR